jgi:hypothetical protein
MNDNGSPEGSSVALTTGFSRTDRIRVSRQIAYKGRSSDKRHAGSTVFVAVPGQQEDSPLFNEGNRNLNCPLTWNLDGTTIYHSHKQIYALDVATGTARAITRFRGKDQFSANWLLETTPEGLSLITLHMPVDNRDVIRERSAPSPRLCIVSLQTGKMRVLFEPGEGLHLWKASLQPRCQLSAVALIGAGNGQLWRVPIDGSNPRMVTALDSSFSGLAPMPFK